MNPDTNSPDDGDARMEELLRGIPQPQLPPDWRSGILHAAKPPVWPWLTRPVRWGLAACWAAIALFHLTAPPRPPSLPGTYAAPPPAPLDLEKFWLAAHDGTPLDPEFPAP